MLQKKAINEIRQAQFMNKVIWEDSKRRSGENELPDAYF